MRIGVLTDCSALSSAGLSGRLTPADSSRLDRHPAAVYLAGLAPGSRRTMRGALRIVAHIISDGWDELALDWSAIDYAHTAAVRATLIARYAPATVNKLLAALRGTIKAAFVLGLISSDQMTRACAVRPSRGSRLPKGRALSSGELRAMFNACDADTTSGARDAAILSLLYGSGLRRSEVVGLDVADLDVSSGNLRIRGKGNKERVAFLGRSALEALQAWLQRRGECPGPLFFPVMRSGVLVRRRLNDQTVLDLVVRLGRVAGVRSLSPHDFRRSFVGDLLDAGVDLATVQALAGHASPTTTALYDRRPERTRRRAASMIHVPYGG